jgi:aerobic carbon-monoxide dehydrogenase medium subunit
MYPDEFDYYGAETVDEALGLLDEHADRDPMILAGGHSLIPTMKSGLASPDIVIDISGVDDLHGIEHGNGALTIGASTVYSEIVNDGTVAEKCPVLAKATAEVGDTQVRNRGTVGGNIAHADPASDLPAAMLAAGATIYARGPDGERAIDVDDFFLSVYMTALEPDEILTRIEVPTLEEGVGVYEKKANPSSGYAIVGVAAQLETDSDQIETANVAANGVMDHAVRLEGVEDTLQGQSATEEAAAAAAERAMDDLDPALLMDDVHVSNEYRAKLLEAYTRRALTRAVEGQ